MIDKFLFTQNLIPKKFELFLPLYSLHSNKNNETNFNELIEILMKMSDKSYLFINYYHLESIQRKQCIPTEIYFSYNCFKLINNSYIKVINH